MLSKVLLMTAAVAGLVQADPWEPPQAASGGTYLGVWIWQVDAARAQQLRLPEVIGVEITRVRDDSPADHAGLKAGDVVTHYNGERVQSMDQFSDLVRQTRAGAKVELQIYRNGAPQMVTAKVAAGAGPRVPLVVPRPNVMIPDLPRSLTTWRSPALGIDSEAIDGQLADYFGVTQGVLVRNVAAGSPAQRAGIKAGDVIVAVGTAKVATPVDITMRLRELEVGSVVLAIVRERKESNVTVLLDTNGR